MNNTSELRLAVLIDAENIASAKVKSMMEEIAKYGTPTFKRIYGDWTKPHIAGWKNVLLENAITPVQQYSYTTGKNASDSAMIIDAMDILYTGKVEGFCILSSDSDFTRLATRLREAGMKVYGMGEKKTPAAFISACDKFIYIEILENEAAVKDVAIDKLKVKAPAGNKDAAPQNTVSHVDKALTRLVIETIDDLADEDGWALLSDLGTMLLKKQPDFDPRNYGYIKLSRLVKTLPDVEIEERPASPNAGMRVRIKTSA